jgi:hypothetical protein
VSIWDKTSFPGTWFYNPVPDRWIGCRGRLAWWLTEGNWRKTSTKGGRSWATAEVLGSAELGENPDCLRPASFLCKSHVIFQDLISSSVKSWKYLRGRAIVRNKGNHYIYIYIYSLNIYIYIYIYSKNIYSYICIYIHTYVYIHIYVYIFTYICIYILICMYIYILKYMYMYTYFKEVPNTE